MQPIVDIESLETFAEGLDHAEGITLAPDGHLYVGGEAGQLYRIEDDRLSGSALVRDRPSTATNISGVAM